uniref:hydroxysteroid 11-beta-dehydrogenase 1-like protein n=1 Tax=Styela clava TaxID=7725 RepID=UPI001939461D|nr:hydroxysteroid 11-beta-dehydrogenase 1-like protein [Styela clava]
MARIFLKSVFVVTIAILAYRYFNANIDRDSIQGKRILVTGASQNIGEEVAYQYSELGAKIVVTARRENELKRVVEKCLSLGAKEASYVVADMTDTTVYESVINKAVNKLGGLDILVLNHVISRHGKWEGSKDDLNFMRRSIPVNYVSYVELASAAMPHLRQSQGQLIVVSSQAGRPGIPNIAAYGATKAAVANFFTSLQLEGMMTGHEYPSITICILGAIDTEGARWVQAKQRMQIQGYPVDKTANVIIEGGITRSRYAYAPPYIGWLATAREMMPEIFDRILLYFVF